jgi:hypothetical protein
MLDTRRILPAVPAALCCGAVAVTTVPLRWLPPSGLLAVGAAATAFALVALYRQMATWTDRSRRTLGYVTATVVGAVVAAGFLWAAFGTSLCGLFGEQCSDAELAAARRYLGLAPVGFVGVLATYAVLDVATWHWSRRRPR